MKVTLVVPVFNEEMNIRTLLKNISEKVKVEHELIIVNDGSTDNTLSLLSELSVSYPEMTIVNNSLEKGFCGALKTGFSKANTELVVPVMGDLCDDLETIAKMYEKINYGYDIICGSRYMDGGSRSGGRKAKGFLSRLAGNLICILGIPCHDITNSFKMYKKNVIDSIKVKSKSFEISMELPLKAFYKGFKIAEVPTVWNERTEGESSFKMFRLLPLYLKWLLWVLFRQALRINQFNKQTADVN